MARRLVNPLAGKRLLDYGCGDASFLALVHDLFPVAVGADLDEKQNVDCRRRFADWPGLSILHTDELADPRHEHAYDVVTCMEVLEHCLEDKVEEILRLLRRLTAPDGIVIVSGPIEIGPSLLLKEALRTIAGWRRLGDYKTKERYSLRELTKMVFAGDRTAIERPSYRFEYAPGCEARSYGHKGFNWKTLRGRVQNEFLIERTRFTALGWSRGWCSSQVWMVCRPPG
jgi:SAM-dependent methyltransferase